MGLSSLKRDIGVDLLRALGMLYIIGYWHIFNYTNPFPIYKNIITELLIRTDLAVFVLMSGYYVAKGYSTENFSVIEFYKKKVLRIYPLYIIAIFLYYFFNINGGTILVFATFSLSMFIEPAPITLWFVSMIMIFFAITPIILKILFRKKMQYLLIVSGIFVCVLLFYEYITGLLDIRILMYFPAYLLGIIMAQKKVTIKKKLNYFFILIICILPLFLLNYLTSKNLIGLVKIPFITYTSFLLFKWAKNHNLKANKIKNLVLWISFSTWCMYLFHRPIYMIILKLYHPEKLGWQLVYLLLVGIPIIILSSFVIQYIYDKIYKWVIKKILLIS